MVSISRVCSKQQDSYGNKGFVFYGKLQKRVENRKEYKEERKDKESDEVCRENEESTQRSRSSIKESIGRYEETNKSEKERNQRLKEGKESDVEYEGLGVQRMTSEKVSRPICRPIYNRGSSIHKCS